MDGTTAQIEPMTDDDPQNAPGEPAEPPESSPASRTVTPRQIVEALLMATDSPLAAARIADILGVGDARDVRGHIEELNETYDRLGLSFRIEEIAGGFQMLTRPVYNTWLSRLLRARQDGKLSAAALETLAIIAYKQPVTRADIESIRGVAAGDLLGRLRDLNLVKIVGRAEDLGRPLLYGTTKKFLEVFGLASLEDLPKVEVLREGMKGAGNNAEIPPPVTTVLEKSAEQEIPESASADTDAGEDRADASGSNL